MAVVESSNQFDVPAQQHAITEDIARHIADANAREILGSLVNP